MVTSDFAKGMQTDIYHYLTRDKINNASFRQKLDPISKNISTRQNPLESAFEEISTFDAENPIVGSLLRELDVGKIDVARELVKKVPGPPELDFVIQNRLNKLKEGNENINNSKNFSLSLHHHLHYYQHNHHFHDLPPSPFHSSQQYVPLLQPPLPPLQQLQISATTSIFTYRPFLGGFM